MGQSIVKCLYTADNGDQYRLTIRRTDEYPLAAEWGFGNDDASYPTLPSWLKPRYAIFYRQGAPNHRVIKIGSKTCRAWTIRPRTLNLPDADGEDRTYNAFSWFNEEIRKHS